MLHVSNTKSNYLAAFFFADTVDASGILKKEKN
jgi:hypothetical protein